MRSTRITIRIFTVIHACVAMLGLAFAQESNDPGTAPSIHAGEWLEVIPRVKIQVDLSTFRPHLEGQPQFLHGRRLRFGIDGTLFRDFGYSARIETRTGDPEFRDLF